MHALHIRERTPSRAVSAGTPDPGQASGREAIKRRYLPLALSSRIGSGECERLTGTSSGSSSGYIPKEIVAIWIKCHALKLPDVNRHSHPRMHGWPFIPGLGSRYAVEGALHGFPF